MVTEDAYEFKKFAPSMDGGKPDHATRAWIGAVSMGFHATTPSDALVTALTRAGIADEQTLTGVYDRQAPSEALDAPVGTFLAYRKTINVGGSLLPTHMISAVTVRPTHRRRGILRRMMADSLSEAADQELPIAALTASEGTIYRRFGFGAATHKKSMTVNTAQFRLLARPAGTVEIVDAAELETIAPDVFAEYHRRQIGSAGRQQSDIAEFSGRLGENGEPDRAVRAAVHYDPTGTIDGYVSYKAAERDADVARMSVLDLIAVTPDAYRGLWQFLGSLDLIDRVMVPGAHGNDLLPASLTDSRAVSVTGERDHLWLRILDVPAALEARKYGADGVVDLRVDDSLGHARGCYRLNVTAGRASVQVLTVGDGDAAGRGDAAECDGDAAGCEVTCDVADLSAIYLGAVSPSVLVDAGRIGVADAEHAATLSAMFAPLGSVYCTTEF